jgi:hypothetical protein
MYPDERLASCLRAVAGVLNEHCRTGDCRLDYSLVANLALSSPGRPSAGLRKEKCS